MLVTNLLVKIFEVLEKNKSKEKISRRLYCESGQAGIKSHKFVNYTTKAKLEQIIPKCRDCKHNKLQVMTVVLAFNELVKTNNITLFWELYRSVGQIRKTAYKLCNQKTQKIIRLQKTQKEV